MGIENYQNYAGAGAYSEEDIEQEESKRQHRLKEAWRFFLGQHWDWLRDPSEPLVTVNLTRSFIRKIVAFCASAGFNISTPKPLEHLTLPLLKRVWEENNKTRLGIYSHFQGSISGDVMMMVTNKQVLDKEKELFGKHSSQKIRILLLNSAKVSIRKHPQDDDVVVYARIEREYYDATEKEPLHRNKLLIEEITPEFIKRKIVGKGKDDVKESKKPNDLGEVPIVHIKNLPVPNYKYGQSDLEDMIPLNREMNEKMTDCSDIINYQGSPITVITGARAKNLLKHSKAMWSGLPKDAKVFNLEMETDLPAANEYLDRIQTNLHIVSNVPEGSVGKIQPISNTSAAALHIMYQPLIELANLKRAMYQPGFEKINYLIIRIAQLKGLLPKKLPMDLCATCGGKILPIKNTDGNVIGGKCYKLDPETMGFLKAENVKIPFIRRHGIGDELAEITYKQAKKEHNKINASYWDMETESDIPEIPEEELNPAIPGKEGTRDTKNPLPPELVSERITGHDKHLLSSVIKYPNEPELVEIEKGKKKEHIVPTGCLSPQWLNPYTSKIKFLDTLPKDLVEMANLSQLFLHNDLWSHETAMDHIGVEDPTAEAEKIRKEKSMHQGVADVKIKEEIGGFIGGTGGGASLLKKAQPIPPRHIQADND